MTERKYEICSNCVMDTTDTNLKLDEHGECERCKEYKSTILPEWNYGKGHEQELKKLLDDIKRKGKGKEYDCILGLSGGLDSSYLLHLAVKEWGLRPFVFHIDCGWNLPVAEENIHRLCDKLGVHLHIEKMDWDEMREMQKAFFRTGLAALDTPQDHCFIAMIDKYSLELGVKYIFNGYNICTEIVSNPQSWFSDGGPSGDGTFVKDVIKKYCDIPIKKYTYTNGFKHKFWIPYVLGVKTVKPLNLVPFTKQEMTDTLAKEYGYVAYGQKHFEDLLTKFLEGWWNPTRFGFETRRAQLSSLVMTGQVKREDALEILSRPPLSEEEAKDLFKQVAAKLEVTEDQLMKWHDMPKCTEKFKSQKGIYNFGIKLYYWLGIEKRIRK